MLLSPGEKIINEEKFIKSHEAILAGRCNERMKEPYAKRLEAYREKKFK